VGGNAERQALGLQQGCNRARLKMVRWTCKFAAFMLLLTLSGSPVLACVLQADGLSEDERECCREMADQCGSSTMPASHSCCKEVPQFGSDSFVPLKSKSLFVGAAQSLVVIAIAPLPRVEMVVSAQDSPVPSKSPPGKQSVLRI